MSRIEDALSELGLTLPTPAAPVATYVPFVIHQGVITISGQLPFDSGTLIKGCLGDDMGIEAGVKAAQACALGILAQAKAACEGDFERLGRCLRLGGFVASTPQFTDHPKIINGASNLIGTVMGDDGVHARAAVGVASLPLGAAVEIDAIFTLRA